MLSVLKTILSRLEQIEKQLNGSETPVKTQKAPLQREVQVKDDQMVLSAQARTILLEAKDEAFRIKREADDEARRLRQEGITIEQRILSKEDSIDKKLSAL